MVPIISSASYPSIVSIGIFMDESTSFISGTCSLSSSGIDFLVPLYSAYALCLNVGADKSKATAI